MPPPRKIDLLPPEFRAWLQEELRTRGFSGYEDVAEALNFRLEEAGLDLRIRKSAIHVFGSEYQEFVRLQEQASDWAKEWLGDMGMEDQAQRQNVLFQMLTTLAFKVMQAEVEKKGAEISPQNLHFLARMAYASRQTLNAANYGLARAAMMSMRGHRGRKLNLKPKLLVVSPSLEGTAREILLNERDAAGATNKWRNTAELHVETRLTL